MQFKAIKNPFENNDLSMCMDWASFVAHAEKAKTKARTPKCHNYCQPTDSTNSQN